MRRAHLLTSVLLLATAGLVLGLLLPERLVLALLSTVLFATVGVGAVAFGRLSADHQRILAGNEALQRRTTRIVRRLDDTRARGASRRSRAGARAAKAAAVEPTSCGIEVAGALAFDGDRPQVVLLLQGFAPGTLFAGIRTAVLAGAQLASRLGRPLRVVVLEPSTASHAESLAALRALIRDDVGLPAVAASLRLSTSDARDHDGHSEDDVWVVTFWTTAYTLNQLVARGLARADRVVYVIQDFEPGFYPWGHLYAQALSTYGAGFRSLVNSRSLADFVARETDQVVDPQAVFAPALEVAPLHRAAERWTPGEADRIRVLFYARPSKPRNMFTAGVQALRLWADGLPDGVHAVVRFAGEEIRQPVDLGPRVTVEMMGKLSYDLYYDLLSDTDIGLALMLSPHPGHLALELPMAGIPTVTNGFGGCRVPWVDGLEVVDTDPHSIAGGLGRAAERARSAERHTPRTLDLDLGGSAEAAVDHLAGQLDGSRS